MNSFDPLFLDKPFIRSTGTRLTVDCEQTFTDKDLKEEMEVLALCQPAQFYQLLKQDPERYLSLILQHNRFAYVIKDRFSFQADKILDRISIKFDANFVTMKNSSTAADMIADTIKLEEGPLEMVNLLPQTIQGIEVGERNSSYFQNKSKALMIIEHERKIAELLLRMKNVENALGGAPLPLPCSSTLLPLKPPPTLST